MPDLSIVQIIEKLKGKVIESVSIRGDDNMGIEDIFLTVDGVALHIWANGMHTEGWVNVGFGEPDEG